MSQYEIAKTIYNASGQCPIDKLEREVDCTKSTLYSVLNRLEQKNVIEKAGVGKYVIQDSTTEAEIERLKPLTL